MKRPSNELTEKLIKKKTVNGCPTRQEPLTVSVYLKIIIKIK